MQSLILRAVQALMLFTINLVMTQRLMSSVLDVRRRSRSAQVLANTSLRSLIAQLENEVLLGNLIIKLAGKTQLLINPEVLELMMISIDLDKILRPKNSALNERKKFNQDLVQPITALKEVKIRQRVALKGLTSQKQVHESLWLSMLMVVLAPMT
jgi:hypothetical protein